MRQFFKLAVLFGFLLILAGAMPARADNDTVFVGNPYEGLGYGYGYGYPYYTAPVAPVYPIGPLVGPNQVLQGGFAGNPYFLMNQVGGPVGPSGGLFITPTAGAAFPELYY